jgi:hypothetical protein
MIMHKKHLALLLAGALLIPQVTVGLGNDSTVGVGSSPGSSSVATSRSDLGMPAVPHREMIMPWIQLGPDTTLHLKIDPLGYFVVQPDTPGAQFCTGPKVTRIWTE